MMIMGGDIEVVMMVTQGWILELMMVDIDIGLKRPANFPLKIKDKLLVVM